MNNIYKKNISHFKYYSKNNLNIKFLLSRYLSIKKPVSASDTTNMELKIVQNLSTEARHEICNYYNIQVATPCDN